MSEIRNVGVCGAGLMGNGIAQTCASAGFNVVLMEVAEEPLERGVATSPNRSISSSRKANYRKPNATQRSAASSRPPT